MGPFWPTDRSQLRGCVSKPVEKTESWRVSPHDVWAQKRSRRELERRRNPENLYPSLANSTTGEMDGESARDSQTWAPLQLVEHRLCSPATCHRWHFLSYSNYRHCQLLVNP